MLKACAILAHRRKWLVIGIALFLTALAGYASTQLTIDTSTDEILSRDLRFRQIERNYRSVFPQEEMVIVVIDASSANMARAAATDLAQRLRRNSDLIERVDVPGASPHFIRHALLFLSPEKLRSLSDQLVGAQLLLTRLGQDPSLRGIADLLRLLEAGAAANALPPEAALLLAELAETISARAEGRPATMGWSSLIGMGADRGRPRALVMAKPVLMKPPCRPLNPLCRKSEARSPPCRAPFRA